MEAMWIVPRANGRPSVAHSVTFFEPGVGRSVSVSPTRAGEPLIFNQLGGEARLVLTGIAPEPGERHKFCVRSALLEAGDQLGVLFDEPGCVAVCKRGLRFELCSEFAERAQRSHGHSDGSECQQPLAVLVPARIRKDMILDSSWNRRATPEKRTKALAVLRQRYDLKGDRRC